MIPSEMSCVCPWNRWSALRSSSWNHKKKKSGTKEGFLFPLCYVILYRDLGFQRKGRDFLSPFAFLARVASNSWHSQKCLYLPFWVHGSYKKATEMQRGFKGLCMRNRRNPWVICPLLSRKLISWNNLVYLRHLLEFFVYMMKCFFQKRTREVSWQRWW